MSAPEKRALVAGWFSYEGAGTTAGDLMAKDLVAVWLAAEGYQVDVALGPEYEGGLRLDDANPDDYAIAVFVCGPFMPRVWEARFLGRFARCFVVGVNLSLPEPLATFDPFDVLLERDSDRDVRPDVTFLSTRPLVPVVGLCLVEDYEEGRTREAYAAIREMLDRRSAAVVPIDTRLPANAGGLRSSAEVESLLARMDLVVTTRLHGTVLSLKNGVPVVAIDVETGGAKVKKQADALGWPAVFTVDDLSLDRLLAAYDYCLGEEAHRKAREIAGSALLRVEETRKRFMAAIASATLPGPLHDERERFARSHGVSFG